MTFIYVLPFIYVYFWMVVWSLRKRFCMEIAIGFNAEEATGVQQLDMILWPKSQALQGPR